MDGEAEERVELNSASLVISVSPLMVGHGVETCRRKCCARRMQGVPQWCSRFCSLQYGIVRGWNGQKKCCAGKSITFSGLKIASSVYCLPYSIYSRNPVIYTQYYDSI